MCRREETALSAEASFLNMFEKIIHPRYLSLLEREQLQDLRRAGLSIRAIASEMRRAPSTISRELKRNTVSVRGYMPHTAHRLSVKHRARPRQAKLVTNAELRSYVQGKLAKRWSPQQISHRLIKDFPTAPEMRASTETIYQGNLRPRPRRPHTRTRKSNCAAVELLENHTSSPMPAGQVRRPDELHQQSAGRG
ncbi:transposase [Rhodococcus baikonurensis]|uniref:transposase n=1 Tax=Rhodococcus baikonurensis TaxID=172041 RepID=UPI00378B6383